MSDDDPDPRTTEAGEDQERGHRGDQAGRTRLVRAPVGSAPGVATPHDADPGHRHPDPNKKTLTT